MRIAVTGSTGYIAQALIKHLANRENEVLAISRGQPITALATLPGVQWLSTADGIPSAAALRGCHAVVHLAGRAHTHVAHEGGRDLFDESNRVLALNCSDASREAGVDRFVFVSTLGVHGGSSPKPVTENSPMTGVSPYARSKIEAEQQLAENYRNTPETLCIVRPPMVYGPSCPGNFPRLINLVRRGLPLPFASIHSRRSFIHVDNLAHFLGAVSSCQVPGGTYVIGDESDFTVPELIRMIGQAFGLPTRLIPFPPSLLLAAAHLVGRRGEMESLTQAMEVDWSRARDFAGWTPPIPGRQALQDTLENYARLS